MSDTVSQQACSKCGQEDDHPRHLVLRVLDVRSIAPANADEATIARLDSVYNTVDHIDCCTCHDEPAVVNALGGVESCRELLNRTEGKKGAELRAHLADNPRRIPQPSED